MLAVFLFTLLPSVVRDGQTMPKASWRRIRLQRGFGPEDLRLAMLDFPSTWRQQGQTLDQN
jgi:hypothetical protein